MSAPTYREEIEEARDRLVSAVRLATGKGRERVEDLHSRRGRDLTTHGVWSDESENYIAEVVDGKANADYIVLADPDLGAFLVKQLTATLNSLTHELDTSDEHEHCKRDTCTIATTIDMVRYLNRKT
jgi:hypothetical protein